MYLLFDIGATKTRVAFSPDGKTIEPEQVVATPQNYHDGLKQLVDLAEELSVGRKIIAAAGGVAGPLNKDGVLGVTPHLEWKSKAIKQDLFSLLKVPIDIQNDAALVGLGEAMHGAGRGYEIVAYITISTGVNGVRVVNNKIDEASKGFEIGPHIISEEDGKLLSFGQLVSGTEIEKRYNKMPSQIEDEKIWDEIAKHIAIGAHNTNAFWSPDVIILGGGVMQNKQLTIERIQKFMNQIPDLSVPLRFPYPPVVKSELRDIGGLWGALECAKICGL